MMLKKNEIRFNKELKRIEVEERWRVRKDETEDVRGSVKNGTNSRSRRLVRKVVVVTRGLSVRDLSGLNRPWFSLVLYRAGNLLGKSPTIVEVSFRVHGIVLETSGGVLYESEED